MLTRGEMTELIKSSAKKIVEKRRRLEAKMAKMQDTSCKRIPVMHQQQLRKDSTLRNPILNDDLERVYENSDCTSGVPIS